MQIKWDKKKSATSNLCNELSTEIVHSYLQTPECLLLQETDY